MYDLTEFQRDLLCVVAGLDEPYGLAIKEVLEQNYEPEINHGHFYQNLDILVDKGFVGKGEIDQRTNSYRQTRRGQREIVARREWETNILMRSSQF